MYKLNKYDFLDRATAIYGESSSGKTTILFEIIESLSKDIDVFIVFSPTEQLNGTYKNTIPSVIINDRVDEQQIVDIWDRQCANTYYHECANSIEFMTEVLVDAGGFDNKLRDIDNVLERSKAKIEKISDPEVAKNQLDRTTAWHQKMLREIIVQNIDSILAASLSEDQLTKLRFLTANVKTCVIFDDCTPELGKIKRSTVIEQIMYQARHNNLTVICTAHNDQAVNKKHRNAFFASIFTTKQAYEVYSTNLFKGASAKRMIDAGNRIFNASDKHKKLIYLRETGVTLGYRANKLKPFKLCSDRVREYCERHEVSGVPAPKNNKFIVTTQL